MTFTEAVKETCLECKKALHWSGFKDYGYQARCCGYEYRLEPKVMDYSLVVARVKPFSLEVKSEQS